MKALFTLSALAVASVLSLNAQAASWAQGATNFGDTRFGIAALNDEGDALFGPIKSDVYNIGPDSIELAGFDSLTAVSGANSIDLSVSHEAYAGTSYFGDSSTAYLHLMTSAALDNAVIAEDGISLAAAATAPARLYQTFMLLADPGEWIGMPALVTLDAILQHNQDGSAGINMANHTSFVVYHNGSVVVAGSKDDAGFEGGYWQFNAMLGDTITVQATNESSFEIEGMNLDAGDQPYAFVDGDAFATMHVAAIPEAETYAMLLAGLGLVGFASRRRKA